MSDHGHGEVQAAFVSPEPRDLSGTTKFGYFYLALSIAGLLIFTGTFAMLIIESSDEIQAYEDSVKEAAAKPKAAEGTKAPAAKTPAAKPAEGTEAPAAK